MEKNTGKLNKCNYWALDPKWTLDNISLTTEHSLDILESLVLFSFTCLKMKFSRNLKKDVIKEANWVRGSTSYDSSCIRISFFRAIPSDKSLFLTLETTGCAGTETEVNYLEHVQALITLNTTRRGDVELFLRSPMGTRSMILSTRPNDDDSRDGFTKWPFMTTHTWAEYPRGKWTLEVYFSCQT